MTFWKRLFSADYRRALAAEAAGDYDEAARAYALAGERARVAAMHLYRAERASSAETRLAELRAAVRWADLDEADGRDMRRRIARAMHGWGKRSGLVSESDRQVVRDAAALFTEVGDHAGAAECHELVGDEIQAAESYQKAGELERLESVLAREETRRKQAGQVQESFEEYRLHLMGGERDRALAAIRLCADTAIDAERAEYRRLADELSAKLLSDGRIILRAGTRETTYVGAFPLSLGRESTCQLVLRDAGISRRHAEIDFKERRAVPTRPRIEERHHAAGPAADGGLDAAAGGKRRIWNRRGESHRLYSGRERRAAALAPSDHARPRSRSIDHRRRRHAAVRRRGRAAFCRRAAAAVGARRLAGVQRGGRRRRGAADSRRPLRVGRRANGRRRLMSIWSRFLGAFRTPGDRKLDGPAAPDAAPTVSAEEAYLRHLLNRPSPPPEGAQR